MMYDRPPLIIGDEQPQHAGLCTFGIPDPACSRPAAWHIFWMHDGTTSQSCDGHLDYLASCDSEETPYEVHPHRPPCGEQGTYWLHATDERVGYCFRDADDPAELLATAAIGGQ